MIGYTLPNIMAKVKDLTSIAKKSVIKNFNSFENAVFLLTSFIGNYSFKCVDYARKEISSIAKLSNEYPHFTYAIGATIVSILGIVMQKNKSTLLSVMAGGASIGLPLYYFLSESLKRERKLKKHCAYLLDNFNKMSCAIFGKEIEEEGDIETISDTIVDTYIKLKKDLEALKLEFSGLVDRMFVNRKSMV
jgi:hypothetical protein